MGSRDRIYRCKRATSDCICALERFFEAHTHGILWSAPHAVAVWRVAGAPSYYMMEPHACGPTGLRADAQDDGAACVLTFTSAKLMAFAYLQNVPALERPKHDFFLYAMSVVVAPIKKLGGVEPPLVMAPPNVKLVPATSKVGVDGSKRRALEADRKHPPGGPTCKDAQRASEARDKDSKLKGQRNTSGWLVLQDGSQFLSACHSIACNRYPQASRGNQVGANITRYHLNTLHQHNVVIRRKKTASICPLDACNCYPQASRGKQVEANPTR
ncbi:hypothetical protein MSG28_015310 [Choristoneura fumiferana]|uniref:Uncharacterized protein n=1 Tax=Choristoneura fumiferana TaxID=7141 RepID=A0ACC0KAF4_CHOFU|nr:hypothetical protein MSG28_015310 [Choristoneura fumiferana]